MSLGASRQWGEIPNPPRRSPCRSGRLRRSAWPLCAFRRTPGAAGRSDRSTCRRSSRRAASPRRRPRAPLRRRSALALVLSPSGREDVLNRLLRRWKGARLGERDRGRNLALDLGPHALPVGLAQLLLFELAHQPGDRVSSLPCLDLHLVARVGLRLALGVRTPAIGLALDQRRTLARARPLHGVVGRAMDREDVV